LFYYPFVTTAHMSSKIVYSHACVCANCCICLTLKSFYSRLFFMLGFILKEIMRANGITSTHASLIIRDHINQTKYIYIYIYIYNREIILFIYVPWQKRLIYFHKEIRSRICRRHPITKCSSDLFSNWPRSMNNRIKH